MAYYVDVSAIKDQVKKLRDSKYNSEAYHLPISIDTGKSGAYYTIISSEDYLKVGRVYNPTLFISPKIKDYCQLPQRLLLREMGKTYLYFTAQEDTEGDYPIVILNLSKKSKLTAHQRIRRILKREYLK